MKAYYENRARQADLLREAQEWLGTPFLPHAHVKGGGVDCVWLAAGLYLGTGHLREFKPGNYSMDGGHHNSFSLVTQWVEQSKRFTPVEFPPEVGDLLCFRIGKCIHHVGVVLTEKTFLHVVQGGAVRESRIDDTTWRKRLSAIYRPVEKEARV
ncbi:MAG: hypothetical protein K0Q55_2662 [Verrucomicrobia bacterium]|jgi:cell wall-associated NlpC family hydrolase|nr:hypothetical protein [Verrucomicrobiota bacterium]